MLQKYRFYFNLLQSFCQNLHILFLFIRFLHLYPPISTRRVFINYCLLRREGSCVPVVASVQRPSVARRPEGESQIYQNGSQNFSKCNCLILNQIMYNFHSKSVCITVDEAPVPPVTHTVLYAESRGCTFASSALLIRKIYCILY